MGGYLRQDQLLNNLTVIIMFSRVKCDNFDRHFPLDQLLNTHMVPESNFVDCHTLPHHIHGSSEFLYHPYNDHYQHNNKTQIRKGDVVKLDQTREVVLGLARLSSDYCCSTLRNQNSVKK